jgi:hypothetical protein
LKRYATPATLARADRLRHALDDSDDLLRRATRCVDDSAERLGRVGPAERARRGAVDDQRNRLAAAGCELRRCLRDRVVGAVPREHSSRKQPNLHHVEVVVARDERVEVDLRCILVPARRELARLEHRREGRLHHRRDAFDGRITLELGDENVRRNIAGRRPTDKKSDVRIVVAAEQRLAQRVALGDEHDDERHEERRRRELNADEQIAQI